MRLLLIEDNDRLAGFIAAGLGKAGFAVDQVATAADGEAALRSMRYEVVILDLGLPDADGLTVLAALRGRGDSTSVIVLTARDGVGDRVAGLNQGADDYLLKPFAMEELIARVRVQLRRPGGNLGLCLTQGNLLFDTVARQTRVAGQPLVLTRRELDALEVLMRRAGRVVSKVAIEEAIYAFGEELESNAIEVLIHRLRKRLQSAGADVVIQTLRGVGYLLADKTP
ncbi:response regulator transcription factor [Telmatospirillum sp.]|uniref:response regulator transcription factor n=1 Tax=Telmatospirillum sp. TaxID=2079197 RepID=UPI002844F365|nr:response regulator transcription factor [Telmatospirillum sp.]MDR3440116.1 response regulator transcription factor [Telmatospirillum sp.]